MNTESIKCEPVDGEAALQQVETGRLTPEISRVPQAESALAAGQVASTQTDPSQEPALVNRPEKVPCVFHSDVEPWPEPVSGAVLLDELGRVLERFVVLPERATETLALWILHTYAFGLRDVSTYVGIESPEKRCGKTTLLSVLSELVNRPVVAANISSPAFFRVIEETQPTLIIDEADTFLQGNDELRGILNSGYSRKTAYVVRVAPEMPNGAKGACGGENARSQAEGFTGRGASRLVRFSCWCPKVMAAIGRLPETLADRCIVIRMQRKLADERCERLRCLNARELRRKCLRFVMDHGEQIGGAQPGIPAELHDRAADIWEPLLALADLAGAGWPEKARRAAIRLSLGAQESSPMGSLFLDILIAMVKVEGGRVFSRALVEWLNRLADRPWAELRRGKPITESWLAQQLRPYGIRSKTVRVGEATAKGYVQEEFKEAFRRYIPRAEFEELVGELRGEETEGGSSESKTTVASKSGAH